MPPRCIDAGAGIDGCPKREFSVVPGLDPTWRLAVQADVGGVFGLSASIAHDAMSRHLDIDVARSPAPLALSAPPPFEISKLLNERSYQRDA